MKHAREIPRHRFIYRFTDEEMIALIVTHLRSERWEVPHQNDTATKQLTKTDGHWELVVEKHHPKALVDTMPLRQFEKPVPEPEKKNPMIVDMTNMSPAEILEIAAFKEKLEKDAALAKAKGIIAVTERQPPQVQKYPGQGPDDIAKAVLNRAKDFTSRDIMDELKIPVGNNNGRMRVHYIVTKLCESGDLKKKKVANPAKPGTMHWVYAPRDK